MNRFDFDRWAEEIDRPAEQLAGVIRNYYTDYASWSQFPRLGLWAPARIHGVEGHRFALVDQPDGYPGENIFVAGWADYGPEWHGMDWWPLGIVTPTDFRVCFRYTNGLRNEQSSQPLNYAQHRKRNQSKNLR